MLSTRKIQNLTVNAPNIKHKMKMMHKLLKPKILKSQALKRIWKILEQKKKRLIKLYLMRK